MKERFHVCVDQQPLSWTIQEGFSADDAARQYAMECLEAQHGQVGTACAFWILVTRGNLNLIPGSPHPAHAKRVYCTFTPGTHPHSQTGVDASIS